MYGALFDGIAIQHEIESTLKIIVAAWPALLFVRTVHLRAPVEKRTLAHIYHHWITVSEYCGGVSFIVVPAM